MIKKQNDRLFHVTEKSKKSVYTVRSTDVTNVQKIQTS